MASAGSKSCWSFLSDEKICRRGVFGASGELLTDVTVNSPKLIPGGSAAFIIKEVIHRQSSAEGTTTDILITNENGLGSERVLAQAARSPRAAATRANRAARAATEPEATEPAAAATTAAAAPAATSAATASSGFLYAAANVFPIEDIERGETDVGHFLFAKNEALIGRGIVRLRDTGGGHRGCGCTTHQRKTQSGGTQHLYGGGFGCAFLLRSLLDP
jgi:hypothetical protein